MKKFKPLKMCPSRPDEREVGMDGFYIPVDDFLTFYPLPASEMVDYPEFWEEMEEPEYIIQSFIGGDGRILRRQDNGRFSSVPFGMTKEETLLSYKSSFKVHSIQRTSDNEVFTLGDEITSRVFAPSGEVRTITEFRIGNEYSDDRKYIVTASNGGINLLENIERHTPDVEPTFTKEEVLKALSRSIDVHKTVKVTLGKELNLKDFVIDWDKFEKELDSLK